MILMMNASKPISGPATPARTDETGVSPARAIALRVLSDLREGRQTAREAIDSLISRHPASGQDRGLATELVMGVVRHRLTLARLIGRFTTRGWNRVGQRIQHILMIGAYQLIWLDGIPAFAAVDQAVEQAKCEGGKRAGQFVNGVLRSLIRDIEQRRLTAEQGDSRRSVLVSHDTVCQFKREFLIDPQEDPIAYWSDATSHPGWLISRWRDAYGMRKTIDIARAGMNRPPIVLRPNRLKTDAPGLAKRLAEEGVTTEILPEGAGLVVTGGDSPMQTRAFEEGLFQPQDRTAMEVLPKASDYRIKPGDIIVDLCAGLGTKATQLAEMTRDRGVVLATDKDGDKLELLRANALRLGCQSIQILSVPETVSRAAAAGGAHWVLVDAPCSNTGVLARRPEARYRLTPHSLETLNKLQIEVLAEAAQLLRPQGRLIYSTCSIDPQENEQVAAHFSETHPDWRFITSETTLPQAGPLPTDWRDGGYFAVWQKP